MGFLGLFGRKKEELPDFNFDPNLPNAPLSLPSVQPAPSAAFSPFPATTHSPFSFPSAPSFDSTTQSSQSYDVIKEKLEAISAKLDVIKITLDSLNQRISMLEREKQEVQLNNKWRY